MATLDARALILAAIHEAVAPDPELHLDAWAERHVIVPKGSAFAGPYRLAHTPMARHILQALSPGHPAKRVVAKVASQMLKTQVFICAALGWIHSAPANIIALEPNKTVTQRLSNRLEEAIRACDAVRDKVAGQRSRDKRNTIEDKQFDGGHLYILTAGSDANLAEVPARYLFCDEINREGWTTGAAEGDRVRLALARLTSYDNISKAYIVSSPTTVGDSAITDWFEKGTQEHYHVPCPHCGELHELVIENFRHAAAEDGGAILRAWFVCPACGAEIEEADKPVMLPDEALGGRAKWVATAVGDGETISVTLPAFYAPPGSISWKTLAQEYRDAMEAKERGDHERMQVFVNTRLGLDYDRTEITSTVTELVRRAHDEALPTRIVPDEALVLTAYADTQPNRLEVSIEAWGPGLEHWTVDHIVLWGDPTDPPEKKGSVWQALDDLRKTPLEHASGAMIQISAYGIDSGGANTQDVYNYGAGRAHVNCLVTKGSNIPGRPIIASRPSSQDIDWQGERRPDGVKLWMIGADTAKDWLANRLKFATGPGAAHWAHPLGEDFFEQLLAERSEITYRKGRQVRQWVKANSDRNEALDCAVGNLACAHFLGLHKWAQRDWDALRESLLGNKRVPAPAPAPQTQPAQQQPAAPAETPPAPKPPPPSRRVLSKGLYS